MKPRFVHALIAALVMVAPLNAQQKSDGKLGIDVTGMDRSVRPQDDFFRFVNGGWADRTTIPSDMSTYGTIVMVRDKAANEVRALIEETAAKKHAAGSIGQKVADFYRSFMDTTRVENLGIKPLERELGEIARVTSIADLPAAFAQISRIGVRVPVRASVQPDAKNTTVYAVSLGQSGLSMGDRDYYLRNDEKFVGIRKAFTDYIAQVFKLAGKPDPDGAAQRILALETAIAKKQWDRARSRDRNATYNKMTIEQLSTSAPQFKWDVFLTTLAGKPVDQVIVSQPDFMVAADSLIANTPISTWKEYLTFGLINAYADDLSKPFVDAQFNFNGRVLAGQPEQRPRWKRGVSEVESALGEPVGKLYIAKYFTPEAKARMDQLVKNLLAAFKVGIEELEWMSPATKAEAQAKLAKFDVRIGYPDRWQDYTALTVDPKDLTGNVMRSRRFSSADSWARLGKPVERWRWGMTPQTVNASYSSTTNQITFPAGILQPPFFNMEADDATNYGAIGAVIGHEISHGFDDQGRKSDGNGNLRDWWTPDDAKAFEKLTDKLGAQYEAYSPVEGIHINGKLTMGENIGDLSGLAVAYRAYKISLNGKEAPVIDGFTGDQRFFMGWAQAWRYKAREEALRNQLLTDSHSPGMYRAFVPLTNIDAFYKAFDVKPGDKMYRAPEDRVKIW
jgi:putative endopeptidase